MGPGVECEQGFRRRRRLSRGRLWGGVVVRACQPPHMESHTAHAEDLGFSPQTMEPNVSAVSFKSSQYLFLRFQNSNFSSIQNLVKMSSLKKYKISAYFLN